MIDTQYVDSMIKPQFAILDLLEQGGTTWLFGVTPMHPNPRLYKYQWHVFWRGSPCEGVEFWETEPLSTKVAIDQMLELHIHREPFVVSNYRLPRLGVPIEAADTESLDSVKFAPAYDDDPDPPTATGHK